MDYKILKTRISSGYIPEYLCSIIKGDKDSDEWEVFIDAEMSLNDARKVVDALNSR